MRKSVLALALALVASLGRRSCPSVSAAAGDPKVVIIVGATHGATASYRADADVAYAEASKYTSNVVKVYSPNATWSKVKAAVVGASIVIYMGHGNGWPSPYTYDPKYTTKDGFGLNATAGAGDYNNKYYGEPYMASSTSPRAPSCCSTTCATPRATPSRATPSRASRPPASAPTTTPPGSSRPAHRPSSPTATPAPSATCGRCSRPTSRSRTCGGRCRTGTATSSSSRRCGRPACPVFQDPNTPTSGFYRSLAIGTIGVTTDEVISAGYGDTGADPTDLVVPGNAAVTDRGRRPVQRPGHDWPDRPRPFPPGPGSASSTSPTRRPPRAPPLVQVEGLDDPSIAGFMVATDLAPRDSAAPVVRALEPGGPFSPNGDGQVDSTTISGRFTETVAWTLRVHDAADDLVFETTGSGATFEAVWNGLVDGHPVPDGTYAVSVSGVDGWDNAPASATRSVRVDTHAPALEGLAPGADTTQWFSPNGDGFRDTVSVSATNAETGTLIARVLDADGATVKNWTVEQRRAPPRR